MKDHWAISKRERNEDTLEEMTKRFKTCMYSATLVTPTRWKWALPTYILKMEEPTDNSEFDEWREYIELNEMEQIKGGYLLIQQWKEQPEEEDGKSWAQMNIVSSKDQIIALLNWSPSESVTQLTKDLDSDTLDINDTTGYWKEKYKLCNLHSTS